MLRLHAETYADGLKLVCSGRVLAACHASGEVVGDDDGDVRLVVDGVEQSRHARVRERRVANDGYCREQSGVGCTFGHRYRRSHVNAARQCLVWRQCAQRVAAYVAEDAVLGIFLSHLVQGGIHVAVSASLAQLWRACGEVLRGGERLGRLCPEGGGHTVGSQLAGARQCARQSSRHVISCAEHSLHGLLHHRLSVFHHEQPSALVGQHLYSLHGQWILRHLFNIIQGLLLFGQLRYGLLHVVVANAAGHDARLRALVSVVGIFAFVERRPVAFHEHVVLLPYQCVILLSCYARQQHPSVGGDVDAVLLARLLHHHSCARVSQSCHHAQQHWLLDGLRVVEGHRHHVVGLLLCRRLEHGYQRKLAVEPRVLLVLARVHRRVVGGQHHQSALHSGYGTVDECVGAYVHAHVLHAHERPLSGIRHAERSLHGCFLVGAPARVYSPLLCNRVVLNKLGNLC